MRKRLDNIVQLTGHANGWKMGPTEDFPLTVVIVDEAHTFMDIESFKGDRESEKSMRTIKYLTAQLVKKGRSALFLTILLTQKGSRGCDTY